MNIQKALLLKASKELLEHKEVNMATIRELFEYGAFKGLGQWRNGGWGRFSWTEIDPLT